MNALILQLFTAIDYNTQYMTNSEMLQYVADNFWLVTEQTAMSFRSMLISPQGISDAVIAKRRERHNELYATQFVAAGKKAVPYRKMGRYNDKETELYADSDEQECEDESESEVTSSGIAIVYIKGIIQKNSDYCTRGTDEINAEMHELGKDPRVRGVLLCVDSGGGQVSGTEQLADTIYNFYRMYKKRVQAVVDMAGSAAYWIVSGADKIWLSGESSCVGSIGTMASIVSTKDFEKTMGINTYNIYATLSFNKNKEYENALIGDPEPMRSQILDKLNKVFLNAVIRGRYLRQYDFDMLTAENAPEQLTGKVYFGSDGIAIGLADGIKNKMTALNDFANRAGSAGDNDIITNAPDVSEPQNDRIIIIEGVPKSPDKKTVGASLTMLKSIKPIL